MTETSGRSGLGPTGHPGMRGDHNADLLITLCDPGPRMRGDHRDVFIHGITHTGPPPAGAGMT